jgi:hypothetical protein
MGPEIWFLIDAALATAIHATFWSDNQVDNKISR